MLEKDRYYEEARLKRTLEEIDRQLHEKRSDEQAYVKNMRATYRNMWDEVEAAPNDRWKPEQLIQAKMYLDEMRNMKSVYQSTAEKIMRLEKMLDSPYFARIDFLEQGESEAEEIYIGLTMVQNERSLEIFVYDWRAPISGMFYDYDTGKAGYMSPSGLIDGELTLKRQFRIKNGRIEYMFDSDVKIDDDILQELLGRSKDEKMKNIVASIQREQNKAIRDEGHKLLIVEGPAGSGKTSIALHRIAFLLYRFRNSITNENIVIFSPNDIFNDYISEVLPELGEENVRQTTFMEYAKSYLKVKMKITDLNEQMEFILSNRNMVTYSQRVEAIRYKSSMNFLNALKEYIDSLYASAWNFEDFNHEGRSIITKEEQMELFDKGYAFLPYIPRLKKIKNRVLYLIKTQELQKIAELVRQYSVDPGWMDMKPEERKKRVVRIVLKQFQPLRERARKIGAVTVPELYKRLYLDAASFKDINGRQFAEMAEITLKTLECNVLQFEDLAPMLYLKGKLNGIPKKESIRHVIIDEAQDYTPLQIEIIRELFPSSSFTVVGDMNQSLNPYSNIGSIEALADIFNTPDTAHIRFRKSYRSTREITSFCSAIPGKNPGIEFIDREGVLPKVRVVDSIDDCVEKLHSDIRDVLKEGFKSIAVICRTRAETEDIYTKLSKLIPCNLVVKAESGFPKKVTVITSYLSKGLEFDAVFVLNLLNPYQGEEDRNLFYTVCSRALHRLTILAVNRLPGYFNNIPATLYTESR